jgi:hypothetical protein
MPPAGIEFWVPPSDRPHTYALDRADNGISENSSTSRKACSIDTSQEVGKRSAPAPHREHSLGQTTRVTAPDILGIYFLYRTRGLFQI